MASYSVLVASPARKELADIPARDRERILARIGSLADDPRPAGCEKLSLQEKYRVRRGDHRIAYTIQDADVTVWVINVGHRRDVYRNR
jgi:mRNA interferase RelE/StbE